MDQEETVVRGYTVIKEAEETDVGRIQNVVLVTWEYRNNLTLRRTTYNK
jgi:hypothetical protein